MKNWLLILVLIFPVAGFAQSSAPDSIYTCVDQMPAHTFDMSEYLLKNIHLVDSTIFDGRFVIKFVVNEDGSISNGKIIRGINEECDKEILRVVQAMPKWTPGKRRGVPVKVYFTIPIQLCTRDW